MATSHDANEAHFQSKIFPSSFLLLIKMIIFTDMVLTLKWIRRSQILLFVLKQKQKKIKMIFKVIFAIVLICVTNVDSASTKG